MKKFFFNYLSSDWGLKYLICQSKTDTETTLTKENPETVLRKCFISSKPGVRKELKVERIETSHTYFRA